MGSQKILENPRGNMENPGKSSKILENPGKSWKIVENLGKSRKIVENPRKSRKIVEGGPQAAEEAHLLPEFYYDFSPYSGKGWAPEAAQNRPKMTNFLLLPPPPP